MNTTVHSSPAPPASLFKKRTAKATARKRPATPPPASDPEESGYTSSEGEGGQRIIKRRKKSAVITASSNKHAAPTNPSDLSASTFTADRSTEITETNDATKASNWFDETSASQLLGSSRSKTSAAASSIATATANGTSTKPSSKPFGPQKAPANVRTITVTDFAPDVCKDYKQTGFCGFGDSCKFLHAREDYKQGWELDREWEVGGKNSKAKPQTTKNRAGAGADGGAEEDEDKLLENIPFACVICKEPYKYPIVTKCGHYFCEKCALDRYRSNPHCAICGAGTMGVFNGAKQLRKLLDKKRERARQRREKAREDGDNVSSEDEEERKSGREAMIR